MVRYRHAISQKTNSVQSLKCICHPRSSISWYVDLLSREQVPLDPMRVAQGIGTSHILRVESFHLLRILNKPFELPAYLGRLGGWFADLEERLQDEGNPAAICEFWGEMLHRTRVLPSGEFHGLKVNGVERKLFRAARHIFRSNGDGKYVQMELDIVPRCELKVQLNQEFI